MMKKRMRIAALLLSILMLCMPLTVSAMTSTENPTYSYVIYDDGTVCLSLTRFQMISGGFYFIPATIDGYEVSCIDFYGSGVTPEAYVLPGTIRNLNSYTLPPDETIKTLYLSEGLQTISYFATINTGIQEIVIPSTVTSIENKAFGWYSRNTGIPGGSTDNYKNFTVYSRGNEVARAYAELEGYTYVELEDYARGDTDLSGGVDMLDALTLYQIASGVSYGTPVQRAMADCTEDTKIDMTDVLTVYIQTAGLQ